MLVVFFTEGKIVPARRFRVEHFLKFLKNENIRYIELLCWPSKYFNFSFKNKFLSVLSFGFLSIVKACVRVIQLPIVLFADVVFIQRELLPYNIIFLERLVRILNKNIVFDFDDSIFLYKNEISSPFGRYLTKRDTIGETIAMSKEVICGNGYLKAYASGYNKNITIIPTVLDTDRYFPPLTKKESEKSFVIGWMGTSGNLKYLVTLVEVFREIHKRYPESILRIITDRFLFKDEFSNVIPTEFRMWSASNEVSDLQGFNVGLMPLVDDKWTRGKCGFKILQYMATGIPVVASAVGANNEIVQSGVNGFLVKDDKGWIESISTIIEDKDVKRRLSKEGRRRVEENYSIRSVFPLWMEVLKRAMRK